ncbi:LysR family transcriptional regulator [Neisseria weixii]|uniref:LysR family transcriptional regulator n=1 Tax=Neisseria weixii TaxID=1853276 RepID=UPI00359FE005
MDYFSALKAFHLVAETGSFSAAAKQLGVAVSSVTRQIDQLEAQLGVALLTRSTRQLSLNHAGVLYREQTRTILEDLQAANLALKQELGEPQGRLRLTFPPAYADKLAPVLAEFSQIYPKIALELYASDDFIDLQAERMDLAVRIGKTEHPHLIARFLHGQKRLLCASPDYLAQYGTPHAPEDLAGHNCLQFAYRGYAPKWHFWQGKQAKSLAISGNLTGNSIAVLLHYALNGFGITHLPDWLIADELRAGRLKTVLTDWQITPSSNQGQDGIFLVYPQSSRQIVKTGLLADLLLERLGDGAG